MNFISHKLLLVLLCAGHLPSTSLFFVNQYQNSLVEYLVTLVKYLASLQAGTFDCWLYHAISNPPGSSELLQKLQLGLGREAIPALSTSSSFNWSLVMFGVKFPSLVIMHIDYTNSNRSMWENCGRLTGTVSSETRIILLVNSISEKLITKTFLEVFSDYKLYNMFFLSTDRELAIVPDFVHGRLIQFSKFQNPKLMFPDQSRNLRGTPVRYSLVKGVMNACTGNECYGYDVTLVKEMARYLNTTAQYVKFVCPYELNQEEDYLFNCVRDVAYESNYVFDIFVEPSAGSDFDRTFLQLPIPFENVFLAPSGRSLSIVELFMKPFHLELWFVIFGLMIVIKLGSMLFHNRFANDPLLLPICGFERFGLNHASRREKFVMISLILTFFFIKNAYETKIISLMSSKPRVRLISSLQDILDTGTTVKADRMLALEFPMFSSLYSYVNYSHQPEKQLDGTSVYMVNGFVGSQLVQRMVNWDFGSGHPRYRIMDERFAMGVAFYPIPVRSALRHHFRFVQKALFEAGISSWWWKKFVELSNGDRSMIYSGGVHLSAEILYYSDLIPLWYIILFGTLISSFVFMVEICFAQKRKIQVFQKRYQSAH